MPKDLKSTKELTIRDFLNNLIGDKETSDSIVPTDSPIDYAAGGLGAKLGSLAARDAGVVVGNEIGSIGKNLAPLRGTQITEELANKSALGQRAVQAGDKMNMVGDLAEGGAANIDDLARAQQAANRALEAKERFAKQLALRKLLTR